MSFLFISSNRGYSWSPGYEVIYKSMWTFHLKYLNIKKIHLIAMSPQFKQRLCVCTWCDNITASCSVHHYHLIFNITIQIISTTWTTLMERRAKFWWAGIWRTEMQGGRSMEKRNWFEMKDLKFTRHSCWLTGFSGWTWRSTRNISKSTVGRRFYRLFFEHLSSDS